MTKLTRAEITKLVSQVRGNNSPKVPEGKFELDYRSEAFDGFGVRVFRSGRASWFIEHKTFGRTRKVTLGDVRVIDQGDAERRAKETWAKIYLDRLDPQAAKAEARRTAKVTFEKVTDDYLATRKVRKRTLQYYQQYLRGPYFQSLHKMPLDEITHEQITLALGNIARLGPSVAPLAFAALSAFFSWAITKGYHPGPSPLLRVDRPQTPKERDRVLEPDEIRKIWLACECLEERAIRRETGDPRLLEAFRPEHVDTVRALSGKMSGESIAHETGVSERTVYGIRRALGLQRGGTRYAVHSAARFWYSIVPRLLFLTACRRNEIAKLTWDEVDSRRHLLKLPAERSKNGQPLFLPLTDTALTILKKLEHRPGFENLFGSTPGRGANLGEALGVINSCILEMNGAALEHWTLHDIRRTVRTGLAELGVRPDICERILNHMKRRDSNQQTYDRFNYEAPMREALIKWESHLLSIVHGTDKKIETPNFGMRQI